MSEDPITEKIRKLLRLAKSSNQAEAQSALAKAMELAARHQVDVSTLSGDDEIAKLVTWLKRGWTGSTHIHSLT